MLCLHFKRFRWGLYSRSKVKDAVSFPMRNLDLTPYMDARASKTRWPPVYDLSAVVIHHGSGYADARQLVRRPAGRALTLCGPALAWPYARRLGSGHYTAMAHNEQLDQWLEYNDSTVTPVTEEAVRSAQAYLLFYTWRGKQ